MARPPTQTLAFEQLRFRHEHGEPILVCVPAPAGFGKSELIGAWLNYVEKQGETWQSTAATGVAATQVSGCTLHSFAVMNLDCVSTIANHPEKLEALQETQGIVIDEVFMNSDEAMRAILDVLQHYPLKPELRRVADASLQHRLFGYRDVIVCGDIRQLPPANGTRAWWSTRDFYANFEIFVLREDRRHEKDKAMQTIKEKMAWGGGLPAESQNASNHWTVDPDVQDFVREGYLRGWGISGRNAPLDIGTALFPRNTEANRWNEACVQQIEDMHGDECEGIDVKGCDPRTGSHDRNQKGGSTRQQMQTQQVLKLRTCRAHRMRVMVLYNHAVEAGWANGTRARLLESSSWSGSAQGLASAPGNRREAQQLQLSPASATDFNVYVVKDDDATILKATRFEKFDVQCIPARADESSSRSHAWLQVQMKPAYALTGHKAQGLTMWLTYIGLLRSFGYGLPYTMATRTPHRQNILFVGVPPKDVFQRLVHKDPNNNLTLIDQKRMELESELRDPDKIRSRAQRRIDQGEISLSKELAARLGRSVESLADMDAAERSAREKQLFNELVQIEQQYLRQWCDRLHVDTGIRTMADTKSGVTTDFKVIDKQLAKKKLHRRSVPEQTQYR